MLNLGSKPGSVRSISARSNICPKCQDKEEKRPCVEWVDILREEFTIKIEGLFREKMKEFTEFIEESLDVED